MADGDVKNGKATVVTGIVSSALLIAALLISYVSGQVGPLEQSLSTLEDKLSGIRALMADDNLREIADQRTFGELHKMFVEVETQFRGMGDRITREHVFQDQLIEWGRVWRMGHTAETTALRILLAAQEERLRTLERRARE